jgi:hypothetical protein
MRTFKTRLFNRFARSAGIEDSALRKAVADVGRGLVDADLGGGIIKQRVARRGEGKSGGFRTIIVFRARERAFFVYAFAKNARQNIRDDELQEFRRLAVLLLGYSDGRIAEAIETGALIEVGDDEAVS